MATINREEAESENLGTDNEFHLNRGAICKTLDCNLPRHHLLLAPNPIQTLPPPACLPRRRTRLAAALPDTGHPILSAPGPTPFRQGSSGVSLDRELGPRGALSTALLGLPGVLLATTASAPRAGPVSRQMRHFVNTSAPISSC
jgi:hypothetical protein